MPGCSAGPGTPGVLHSSLSRARRQNDVPRCRVGTMFMLQSRKRTAHYSYELGCAFSAGNGHRTLENPIHVPSHLSRYRLAGASPALPCFAMLCHALPCFAMLCHALPCFAMLCHALPCFAMLCHALPGASIVRHLSNGFINQQPSRIQAACLACSQGLDLHGFRISNPGGQGWYPQSLSKKQPEVVPSMPTTKRPQKQVPRGLAARIPGAAEISGSVLATRCVSRV